MILVVAFVWQPHAEASGRNLALGKPYTLPERPTYPHCTDPDDRTQLTDGRAGGCSWTAKGTVGWRNPPTPVPVVIDLGAVSPIDEVRIHTIGGGKANVYLPSHVAVLVSDDDRTYRAVGSTDVLARWRDGIDDVPPRSTPEVLRVGGLATRGRYVLVLLDPFRAYLFADEIEVLAGDHAIDGVRFDDQNRFTMDRARDVLPAVRERSYVALALSELASLMERDPVARDAEVIADLSRAFDHAPVYDLNAWCGLGQRVYQACGRRAGIRLGAPFIWSIADPWAQVRPSALPEAVPTKRRLQISAWQGEYESAAVNLHNCSDAPMVVSATCTPLRASSGQMSPSADTITLRTAVLVDARGAGRIGDALVRMPPSGVEIPAGQTRQLWLTVHNDDLPPGAYRFGLDLSATQSADGPSREIASDMIQGELTVAPIRFPREVALTTFAYSYVLRSKITDHAPREALADLRAHYVTAFPLFWSTELPMPVPTPDGGVSLDFSRHDAMLDFYAPARQYLFFWGRGGRYPEARGLAKLGSQEWETQMRHWLTQWVDHLASRGLSYDDYVMYPFDETLADDCFATVKYIKAVDPRIRVFVNSRGKGRSNQMSRIAPYIDHWCFKDRPSGAAVSASEAGIRNSDAIVWSYRCARTAKSRSPLGYYRQHIWRAFRRGDTGCGFWTYADPGKHNGDAWNDFRTTPGCFAVIYGAQGRPNGVDFAGAPFVPSRRWEAWREGVEDYEYLWQLKRAIRQAKAAGRYDAADRGRRTLDRALRESLSPSADYTTINQARKDITEQLLLLQSPERENP